MIFGTQIDCASLYEWCVDATVPPEKRENSVDEIEIQHPYTQTGTLKWWLLLWVSAKSHLQQPVARDCAEELAASADDLKSELNRNLHQRRWQLKLALGNVMKTRC